MSEYDRRVAALAVDYVSTPATSSRSDRRRAALGRDLVQLAGSKANRLRNAASATRAGTTSNAEPMRGV